MTSSKPDPTQSEVSPSHPGGLVRGLTLRAATAIVISDTIGTGIFLVTSDMARAVGSVQLVFAAWIVAGIVVFCGAFCYAELGAAFPKAGGSYVYLNEGLGPLWGYLFGWMSSVLERPVGIATLAAVYIAAVLVFRAAFNFSFLEHTPVYVASLDPKGWVNAWVALSVLVTTVAVMLVAALFDFWPLTRVLPTRHQPAFGLAATAGVVIGTALLYGFFTQIGGLDPVEILVRVAVSLIYGIFLVEVMTHRQLLAGWGQPKRGVGLTVIAASLAVAMYFVYAHSASFVAHHTLTAGPPMYELEIWVANAMLGITFPLMVVVADFFEFWPLHRDIPR